MLIISSQIDLNGERWFSLTKSQQAVKEIHAGRRGAV
jgi:hypothetical protein